MKVSERIHRSAVGIGADRTIREAASIMNVTGVGALVVLDGHAMRGIVTDRDIVRRGLAVGMPNDARIDAVMTTELVTIDADADVHDVFDVFRRHAVRRLPVVRGSEFIGMITIDDLLIELADQLGSLAKPVTAEVLFGHRDGRTPATVAS
jgi:signal-transduction protein with cAMP-binding, CBS, and nucleotidyltransferase domain